MTLPHLRLQALSDAHVLVYHERQKLLAASAENDLLRKASHSQTSRSKSPSKLPRARSPDPPHNARPGRAPSLEQQAVLSHSGTVPGDPPPRDLSKDRAWELQQRQWSSSLLKWCSNEGAQERCRP